MERRESGPGASPRLPAPPEAYTLEYYDRGCGGHETWRRSGGGVLPERIRIALGLVPPGRGGRVLDVGCGRGEAIRSLAEAGFPCFALDFSPDAAVLARETLRRAAGPVRAAGVLGLAAELPLANESVETVLLLDVVEHLAAADLPRVLGEVRRVLAPGGVLVVHTAPNLRYYRFGYPLYRAIERARGHTLPKDPRDRNPYLGSMHVNEQTPGTLRQTLRQAGFEIRRLLLRPADPAPGEPDRRLRRLLVWIAGRPGLRNVLCNDIFVVACPESRR